MVPRDRHRILRVAQFAQRESTAVRWVRLFHSSRHDVYMTYVNIDVHITDTLQYTGRTSGVHITDIDTRRVYSIQDVRMAYSSHCIYIFIRILCGKHYTFHQERQHGLDFVKLDSIVLIALPVTRSNPVQQDITVWR